MKIIKQTIWLFSLFLFFQNCSPKLRVNTGNKATYLKSIQAIKAGLDQEAIEAFEMDLVLILFGEHFLEPNLDLQINSILKLKESKEEYLIQRLNHFTYDAITKKAAWIEEAYNSLQASKLKAYDDRTAIFNNIIIDKVEYFHEPYKNQEENLYPYLVCQVFNKNDFDIAVIGANVHITNDNKPFYEAKFPHKFKENLKKRSVKEIQVSLNNYNNLSEINTYLEGNATIELTQVIDSDGAIRATIHKNEPVTIKDALSLIWFNLSMNNSYLLGLEDKKRNK